MRKLASSLLVALALIVPMLHASAASAATAGTSGHHSGHRHKAHKTKHHQHKHKHQSRHHGHRSGGEARVWDRLAQCESGGRWHIATGNGYYGGVQISAGTWRSYGGARYAALPHKATKTEQIRVAERIRKGQGWGAWPSCSRRIGVR